MPAARHCALLLLVLLSTPSLANPSYDLVILNGRVMDPETRLDAVRNVGIRQGRIAVITADPIEGKQTVDAPGLVVAPGFIDTEQHGLGPWGIKVNLRDGVTTQMDFEVGALNIDQWYAHRAGKTQANFGTVVGQEFARMRVHDGLALEGPNITMPYFFELRAEAAKDGVDGWSTSRSSIDQMNAINAILDEGLRQGAIGIGSTIGYAQTGITTYEMLEAQRTAARYGRLTAVHHRFHPSAATPTEAPTGVNEVLVNAMVLNAPLQIHHDNDYGWWENEEKLALARAQGHNVWATYYPWIAGSGNYGASIVAPDTWEKAMGYRYEETIYDPQLDRFVSKEEFLKFKAEEPGRTLIAYSPPRKEWLPMWTKVAHFVVAGDGMPGLDVDGNRLEWEAPYEAYAGHPRAAGTHAATLRIARENGVPLMHTLSQLSYWTAKHLGDTGLKSMQERGRMQEGMVADIVIFDADNVREHATYKTGSNGLPSSGIPFVLVNGVLVVENSRVRADVFPGQPIRFEREEEGRFTPISREVWLDTYTIKTNPPTLDLDDSALNPDAQAQRASKVDPYHLFAHEDPRLSHLFQCVHDHEEAQP
ncbi:D-glutamate deacylase [Marinobacter hydrocarbonoclasticus]|nr:D-glutamate deacylase [Marinobacter nauticus]